MDDVTTRTEGLCQTEGCNYTVVSGDWNFCPGCGKPTGKQEDPPLILKDSIARLALYKLDPYEFKLFMFIYFETAAVGLDWKRLKQEELEKECDISHPKVLKSLKLLKGETKMLIPPYDNGEVKDSKQDPGETKILHWITSEKKLERWNRLQGYGLNEDLYDLERVMLFLEPFLEKRRLRRRTSYW